MAAPCQGEGIRAVAQDGDRVRLSVGARNEDFAGAIVAVVRTSSLRPLARESRGCRIRWRERLAMVDAFTYESITTIYLAYAGPGPLRHPCCASTTRRTLDFRSHGSALEGRDRTPRASLCRHQRRRAARSPGPCDARARRRGAACAIGVGSVASGRLVARDRGAPGDVRVHARSPGRPRDGVAQRVYLAGDYTDTHFPPTLEAATRSGAAANALSRSGARRYALRFNRAGWPDPGRARAASARCPASDRTCGRALAGAPPSTNPFAACTRIDPIGPIRRSPNHLPIAAFRAGVDQCSKGAIRRCPLRAHRRRRRPSLTAT